jgi:hypothetical protein
MLPIKWLIPIACVSASLFAQTANDLNGLVAAAGHYVSNGMSGARDPETLALSKITGDLGDSFPGMLMTKATDVQHWTFLYKVGAGPATPGDAQEPEAKQHVAVTAQCTQGVFNQFRYSSTPVKGLKSLEYTWVAVSLDNAIANLNANGFVRGFSGVELVRPDAPNWSDEFVYVFNCPWERRELAISCQTGALTWSYGY